MRKHMDLWETVTAVLLVVFVLLVLFAAVRGADAAPARGTGPGYCYGADYPATIAEVRSTGLKGVWRLSVTTDAGSTYTLKTTRGWRAGQAVTLQGLTCGGVFSPSRVQ